MLGAVLMKRGKDGKDRILGKEDVTPAEGCSRFHAGEPPTDTAGTTDTVDREGYYSALGRLGLTLLGNSFGRPKTYERLISDLYTAGWSIKEVKELLDKGPEGLV
jgi:hypothetical protein